VNKYYYKTDITWLGCTMWTISNYDRMCVL